MKYRNGFVSNSSSSSFVVCLPDNLKFDNEETQKALEKLINEDGFYESEDYEGFRLLCDALRPYVIAEANVSSDAGQIIVADKEKIGMVLKLT